MIVPSSENTVRDVTGIDPSVKREIKAFFQGAVYCWVKNRRDEWFAARDLVGGENFDWDRTPLITLFRKHEASGKSNSAAIEAAGQDAGWLLKAVVEEDKRTFETRKDGQVRSYRWRGGEP